MNKLKCKRCGDAKFSAASIYKCDCGGSYERFDLSKKDLGEGKTGMESVRPVW